jgi:transglutaminase-like putative cysteine protease
VISGPQSTYAIDVELDYNLECETSILLAIQPLNDSEQHVVAENLVVNSSPVTHDLPDPNSPARYHWLRAPSGPLSIRYSAQVSVTRTVTNLFPLPLTPLDQLPASLAPWLFASRHCDPVRFERVLSDDVNLPPGWVADGSTILAIRDWITTHLEYAPTSNSQTTATDTYVERTGVCRDFAHLMVALSRAAGVPARFVSCYAWQLDPPDFHAVAEVWLDGRWHLVDATGLADTAHLIRIARTSDAIDASFLTLFGAGQMVNQQVAVTRLDEA